MAMEGSASVRILIALGIVGLFGIITFALVAATLGTLNKRYDNLNQQIDALQKLIETANSQSTTTTASTTSSSSIATGTGQTTPNTNGQTAAYTTGQTTPNTSGQTAGTVSAS